MTAATSLLLALLLLTGCQGGAGAAKAQADCRASPLRSFTGPVEARALPALTGRVVDRANLLSAPAEERLAGLSERLERQTSDQLAIVTLPSLGPHSIEDMGLALGRHWGLGQEGKDNGVLLIVAPNDRKVRIEVGVGLEPVLPDDRSAGIIAADLLPFLREGQYDRGISAGAEAIARNLLEHAEMPRVGAC